MAKHILVTGGNSGIGLALCKLLATRGQPESPYPTPKPPQCYVYMGVRDTAKGDAALKSMTDAHPEAAGNIEVLKIDISDDASCAAAAETLKAKGVKLYAVCNNAGIGLARDAMEMIKINLLGAKRVTEAMVELVDQTEGRIVNTGSGAASMYLKAQDAALKAKLSNPEITFDELTACLQEQIDNDNAGWGKAGLDSSTLNQMKGGYGLSTTDLNSINADGRNGYGLSKAGVNALTLIQAKQYPNLKVVSLTPGFCDTAMTQGLPAQQSPEQGCVSSLVCLFNNVTSGWFYSSDGLRGPFTMTRDPGTPEYQGEENPDAATYNKWMQRRSNGT